MADVGQGKHDKVVVFVNREKCELESEQVQVKKLIECGVGSIDEQYELQKRNGVSGPVTETFKDPEQTITVKNGDHFTTHLLGPINPAWDQLAGRYITAGF